MDEIKVEGRGIKKPRVLVNISERGVEFRVDDDANPEFWLTIRVNPAVWAVLEKHMNHVRAEGGASCPQV